MIPNDRFGVCRICGKSKKLTKEHVPPKSAFNDGEYLQYYMDATNREEHVQWKVKEVIGSGVSLFTLCERCNNKTGRQYGGAYLDFVRAFTGVAAPNNVNTTVEVQISNFFPARIVKQVVSMILSTSNPPDSFNDYTATWNPFLDTVATKPPREAFANKPDLDLLRRVYEDLRSFVNKRNAKGLPASARLYVHIIANKGTGFQTGIFAIGRRSTRKYFWAVVVGHWPIQWVLVLDGEPEGELLEVTEWAEVDFKTRRSQTIQIPCRWAVAKYPLDFRSPEDISKTRFISMMRIEGFVPKQGMNKEQMLDSAIEYARKRSRMTSEGFIIAEFESITYFEANGNQGWLEGFSIDEAQQFLKSRYQPNRP
jgi:hypothetical protein